MKITGGSHKIGRIIGLCMAAMWCSIFFPLIIAAIQERVLTGMLPIILGTGVLFGLAIYYMLSEHPSVELSEEGVCVRILFRKRTYCWEEIQQAGILSRRGNGFFYKELVLVPPKCSKRRHKDKFFLLRNFFTLVKLPYYSEELREYVCKHYGPLDFNLADGQNERSTVVEMDLNETDHDL